MLNTAPITTVRFIATDGYMPEPGQDTASVLVNDTILLDAGWDAAQQMRRFGVQPGLLRYLIVTHCHFDHVYGLPQLLMWRRIQRDLTGGQPLTIIGPAPDIEVAVEAAKGFLACDPSLEGDWPTRVVALRPGQELTTESFHLRTCTVRHYPTGLCYRVDDRRTGKSVVFSGDTAYSAEIGRLAAGSDLLIHEVADGPAERGTTPMPFGHSGALDAAQTALEAGARRLYLVHNGQDELMASAEVAKRLFSATYAPTLGEVVVL